jgi:hypothetical protein
MRSEAGQDATARRDRLVQHLREIGAAGVLSAGLGRRDGRPVLVVLVRKAPSRKVPKVFEGTPVIVTEVAPASA